MTHRALQAETGLTLIETLVAVAIMGIAFTAILLGMTNSIFMSRIHREQATSETTLRSFAEVVDTVDYVRCGSSPQSLYLAEVSSAGFTAPSGYLVVIPVLKGWDGNTSPATFNDPCTSAANDHGLQQLTLRVDPPDARASVSLTVVKRCVDKTGPPPVICLGL